METNHWYTLQVVLHRKEQGTDNNETHEFRDCTPDHVEIYRKVIWQQGLKLKQSATCWEIVSPFAILAVFIIKQDRKFDPSK